MLAAARKGTTLSLAGAAKGTIGGKGPSRLAFRSARGGDLNPKHLAEILQVFADPTAKNRHLPPRSVSGGHIRIGVVGEH